MEYIENGYFFDKIEYDDRFKEEINKEMQIGFKNDKLAANGFARRFYSYTLKTELELGGLIYKRKGENRWFYTDIPYSGTSATETDYPGTKCTKAKSSIDDAFFVENEEGKEVINKDKYTSVIKIHNHPALGKISNSITLEKLGIGPSIGFNDSQKGGDLIGLMRKHINTNTGMLSDECEKNYEFLVERDGHVKEYRPKINATFKMKLPRTGTKFSILFYDYRLINEIMDLENLIYQEVNDSVNYENMSVNDFVSDQYDILNDEKKAKNKDWKLYVTIGEYLYVYFIEVILKDLINDINIPSASEELFGHKHYDDIDIIYPRMKEKDDKGYYQDTSGSNIIFGSSDIDKIKGNEGKDLIFGGTETDYLYGGDHNDIIYGGEGKTIDKLHSGDNNIFEQDRAEYKGEKDDKDTSPDNLFGGSGDDKLYGNKGDDFIYGNDLNSSHVDKNQTDNDILIGGKGNDTLHGGTEKDEYRFFLSDEKQSDGSTKKVGDGKDKIFDSDGKGYLTLNGIKLNGLWNMNVDEENLRVYWTSSKSKNVYAMLSGSEDKTKGILGDLYVFYGENDEKVQKKYEISDFLDSQKDVSIIKIEDYKQDSLSITLQRNPEDILTSSITDKLKIKLKKELEEAKIIISSFKDMTIEAKEDVGGKIKITASYGSRKVETIVCLRDPLILDLDGDGIETIRVDEGVHFDLDTNEFAEKSGWVSPDDGLLTLDRDGDGQVSNGTELFGDATPLSDGTIATSGFQALSDLDENQDGVIDGRDYHYEKLKVWRDLNKDGKSSVNELFNLHDLGIKSLNLHYTEANKEQENGNILARISSYTKTDGSTNELGEFLFKRDTIDTIYEELETNSDIDVLIDINGMGNVRSLHQAMVQDTTGELQHWIEQFPREYDEFKRREMFEQILYFWVGVDEIDSNSRGKTIDAKKLAVVETFTGEDFVDIFGNTNPNVEASKFLLSSFDMIYNKVYADLIIETHLKDIFELVEFESSKPNPYPELDYYPVDVEDIIVDISKVKSRIQEIVDNDEDYGAQVLKDFMTISTAYDLTSRGDYESFIKYFSEQSEKLSWSVLSGGKNVIFGENSRYNIHGKVLAGNDSLFGTVGNDAIISKSGDDHIDSGLGDDYVNGGEGNDNITGGIGNNILEGGEGDDVIVSKGGDIIRYISEGGYDIIKDDDMSLLKSKKTVDLRAEFPEKSIEEINSLVQKYIRDNKDKFADKVYFGKNININDIVYTASIYDLIIKYKDKDFVKIENFFKRDSGNSPISLEFSNGITRTIDDIKELFNYYHMTSSVDVNIGNGSDVYAFAHGIVDTKTFGKGSLFVNSNATYIFENIESEIVIVNNSSFSDVKLQFNNIFSHEISIVRENYKTFIYCEKDGESKRLATIYNNHSIETLEFFVGESYEKITKQDIKINYEGTNTNDRIYITKGNDMIINAYDGDDNIIVHTEYDKTINAGKGNDTVTVSSGHYQNNIIVNGEDGDDVLNGSVRTDNLYGGHGKDNIDGKLGNDNLFGGSGDDYIYGKAGNDHLEGNDGDDWLFGSTDDDQYLYRNGDGNDVIKDDNGYDKLILKDILEDEISFERNIFDLYLNFDNENSIKIDNYFNEIVQNDEDNNKIEEIILDSGKILKIEDVKRKLGINGTNENDTLEGTEGDDIIIGFAGDDVIDSKGGADRVYGGDGSDTIIGGEENDEIYGENHSDIIYGNQGSDILKGGEGNDEIYGGEHGDIIDGGSGNDRLFGEIGNDEIYGGQGNDYINSGKSKDLIRAGSGDDIIILEEEGIVYTGSGSDTVYGGSNRDEVHVESVSDNSKIDVNTIYLNSGNDYFSTRENSKDIVYGGKGNDSILTGKNDDIIYGNEGKDYLFGGKGNDSYFYNLGDENDTILDEGSTDEFANIDKIIFGEGITKDDIIIKFSEYDLKIILKENGDTITIKNYIRDKKYYIELLEFSNSDTLNLEELVESWIIRGTDENDYLEGTERDDIIFGLDGDDEIYGLGGNDTLVGGQGDDYISGGLGDDFLDGEDGADILIGNEGNDSLLGGEGMDHLIGNEGDDLLIGGIGKDILDGGAGNDILVGQKRVFIPENYNPDAFYDIDPMAEYNIITFAKGDGIDRLESSGKIRLKDINKEDVIFRKNNLDLEILFKNCNDKMVMKGYFYGTNNPVVIATYFRSRAFPDIIISGKDLEKDYNKFGQTALFRMEFGNGEIFNFEDIRRIPIIVEGTTRSDRIDVFKLIASTYSDYSFFAFKVLGDDGNDEIKTGYLNDIVEGGSGEDFIETLSGDDYINGGSNSDNIFAGRGNDEIYGESGNDTIYGDYGNDLIDGGSGDDYLNGGLGRDNYIFRKGFGTDVIEENGFGFDTIVFKGDISSKDVIIVKDKSSLIVRVKGTTDSITIKNYFESSYKKIERIYFENENVFMETSEIENKIRIEGTDLDDDIEGTDDIDFIYSYNGKDKIFGKDGNDLLFSGHDNDIVEGGQGDDFIDGGSGRDLLNGNEGQDKILGGSGDDVIYGGEENDALFGDSGKDKIYGEDGSDYIYGGNDNDEIYGQLGKDHLFGDAGNDKIYGGENIDTIVGGQGNDMIFGGQGNDDLFGGIGDDNIQGNEGIDKLYGGYGNDNLFGNSNNDKLYGGLGSDTLNGDDGDDTLYGEDNNDILLGGSGNDKLYGDNSNYKAQYGDDILDGGSGDDELFGYEGDDTYKFNIGYGNDIIFDTKGLKDKVVFGLGINEDNTVLNRQDQDLIISVEVNQEISTLTVKDYFLYVNGNIEEFHFATGEIWKKEQIYLKSGIFEGTDNDDVIDLSTSENSRFVISYKGNDNITGSEFNDYIYGNEGEDIIIGNSGNDTIFGGDGADTVSGGSGNDYIDLGGGSNKVDSGSGDDIVIDGDGASEIRTGTGNDRIKAGAGDDIIFADDGDDYIYAYQMHNEEELTSNKEVHGGAGNDTISGMGGNAIIYGDEGQDNISSGYKIYGGSGDDSISHGKIMFGDAGNDTIYSSINDIEIYGGSGDDKLNGNGIVSGGIGNDNINGKGVLLGGDGNDIIKGTGEIEGGKGNDIIETLSGKSEIKYHIGDGIDKIRNNNGDVSIVFENEIISENIKISKNGLNLELNIQNQDDNKVLIEDYFIDKSKSINKIKIDDNEITNYENINKKFGVILSDDLEINGTDENDVIYGNYLNNTLNGGLGNDILNAGTGSDKYIVDVDSGEKIIFDQTLNPEEVDEIYLKGFSKDTINFSRIDNDLLIFESGKKQIVVKDNFIRTNKIEKFVFDDGSFYLSEDIYELSSENFGSDNNEKIYGFNKDDILSGGKGDDRLEGSKGDDTYLFNISDGNDIIYDLNGLDKIEFGKGITKENILVQRDRYDLIINILNDSLTIEGYYKFIKYDIEGIYLDNGEEITDYIQENAILFGESSKETIYGSEKIDNIDGKGGSDTLKGKSGDDVYIINRGYGKTEIIDYDGGKILFGEDISKEDLEFNFDKNDLKISIKNNNEITEDSIYLKDYTSNRNNNYTLEFKNGDTITKDEIMNIDIEIVGTNERNTLYGMNGNDVLIGNGGDDILFGQGGNDIYLHRLGSGDIRITDVSGELDKIKIIGNITSEDIKYKAKKDNYGSIKDLEIQLGNYDIIEISDFFSNGIVEKIELENGNIIDIIEETSKLSLYVEGTFDNDRLYGGYGNDIIEGKSGNDVIDGQNGNDKIYGDEGNDILSGSIGDDELYGGEGSDRIYSGEGNNIIDGGLDNDFIKIGTGKNTIFYKKGDGSDIISKSWNSENLIGIINELKFEDINSDELFLKREKDNLILIIKNSEERIEIESYFRENHINLNIVFDNNEVWDDSTIRYGSRTIEGTSEDDEIYGFDGNDEIISKAGNDVIYGKKGDDLVKGDSGRDIIKGDLGNDHLYGGEDNDALYGNEGNDILFGETGNDILYGDSGKDKLYGGIGNDYMLGGNDNDVLDGGEGDDDIFDTSGDDTYIFRKGSGIDRIYNYDYDEINIDKVVFEDITIDEVIMKKSSSDIEISVKGSDDKLIISSFYKSNMTIEKFQFSDGTILDSFLILNGDENSNNLYGYVGNDVLNGKEGDDSLFGDKGNDILIGGKGNDKLYGGEGVDTYIYRKGDGIDRISEHSGFNKIYFEDLNRNDVKFGTKQDNSGDKYPCIFINDTNEYLNLVNFKYDNEIAFEIEFADGKIVNLTQGDSSDSNDVMYIYEDDKKVYFGKGEDIVFSNKGNTEFIFKRGDGINLVDIFNNEKNVIHKMNFIDINSEEIELWKNDKNLEFRLKNSEDKVIIKEYFYDAYNYFANRNSFEKIVFKDREFDDNQIKDYFKLYVNSDDLQIVNNSVNWFGFALNITGTDLDDDILGTALDDKIYSREGDDIVEGGSGNDTIYGGSGNDKIQGDSDNDQLFGEDGDDELIGDSGDDMLIGGSGNDLLNGNTGSDTYIFKKGFGNDIIVDNFDGSDNSLIMDEIDISDVKFEKIGEKGSSLKIILKETLETITITNYFILNKDLNLDIMFKNNEVLSKSDLLSLNIPIKGTDGDDELYGTAGDDIFDAGKGNDYLEGDIGRIYNGDDEYDFDRYSNDLGNDTYIFGKGYGIDTISDMDSTVNNFDRIILKDILKNEVKFNKVNGDLIIEIKDLNDKLIVKNYFTRDVYKIEEIEFGDKSIMSINDVLNLGYSITGTDEIDNLKGHYGNDNIFSGKGNDSLYGNDGNDILNGGLGNDWLYGENGNDTYIYEINSGDDVLFETNGDDVLKIQGEVLIDELKISKNYDSLKIFFDNREGSILIDNYFYDNGSNIEKIYLNNEEIDIRNLINQKILTGSEGDNNIIGSVYDDVITGLGGKDILEGINGNDTLIGGTGDDRLKGGKGDDLYIFSNETSVDFITETEGTDKIKFIDGILSDDIKVTRNEKDIYFRVVKNNHLVGVFDFYESEDNRIELVEFSNGVVWDYEYIEKNFLSGTNENDYLYGSNGDDNLNALDGDDTIYTYKGDDIIDGGKGNDIYYLDEGEKTIIFGRESGIDSTLHGDTYPFKVKLKEDVLPNDLIINRCRKNRLELKIKDTEDALYTDFSIDSILFDSTGETWDKEKILHEMKFYGSDNNDFLSATDEDDVIVGKKGNDSLYGYEGNDTYIWNKGDGNDTINELSGDNDTINLNDVNPDDVRTLFSYYQYDLIFEIISTDEKITIKDYFNPDKNTIENIKFANGEIWSLNEIENNLYKSKHITGSDKIDYIYSTYGDDIITGNKGDDRIFGNTGDDTYIWNIGDGNDIIEDKSGTDILQLSISNKDLSIEKSGLDLLLKIENKINSESREGDPGNETITIKNYFDKKGIDEIQFYNGGKWNRENIEDVLKHIQSGTDLSENIEVIKSKVRGYLGDDTFIDTYSSTEYIYYKGEGNDTIIDSYGTDKIVLKDLLMDEIEILKDENDLIIKIIETNENITIIDHFKVNLLNKPGDNVIESIEFSNGDTFDLKDLYYKDQNIEGSEEDEELFGLFGNDTLDGKGGNDILYGNNGDDTYIFSKGYGEDRVIDVFGDNKVNVKDFSESDIDFSINENSDLVLKLKETNEKLLLDNFSNRYNFNRTKISEIEFKDNETLSNYNLMKKEFIVRGNNEDNELYGLEGNDTLDGKEGNDILKGFLGSNTYVFKKGYGIDTIDDKGEMANIDLTDFNFEEINLVNEQNNLVFETSDVNDKLIKKKFLVGIESINFKDKSIVDAEELENMNIYTNGTEENDTLNGYRGKDIINGYGGNDSIHGSYGNDTIIGGVGNDYLDGEKGVDTYIYRKGDGTDTINEHISIDIEKNILLLEDIKSDEIVIKRNDRDLIISFKDSNDSITLENGIELNYGKSDIIRFSISEIRFADENIWKFEEMKSNILSETIYGTNENDILEGTVNGEIIYGLKGDDDISGSGGNDTIYGNEGNDKINGGFGIDTLIGGQGDDYINSSGEDVIIYNIGDGFDTLSSLYSGNKIVFGEGINHENITIKKYINYKSATGHIVLNKGKEIIKIREGDIEGSFEFSDGTLLNPEMIRSKIENKGKYFVFDARNLSNVPDKMELVGTFNGFTSDGTKWIMDEIENNLFVKYVDDSEFSNGENRYKFRKLGDWSQNWNQAGVPFGDDTTFDWPEESIENKIYGSSNDDNIKGNYKNEEIITGFGDDTITGKGGADILKGGSGNDTYKWSIGDGNDEIIDEVGINSLQMSIVSGLLSVEKSGNNLLLKIDSETITVKDFFNNKGVETIELTDTTLSRNDIDDLLNGMIKGSDLDDELTGTAGNDVFLGKKGDDTLIGLAGNDKYIFNKGDGSDLIRDISGSDTIKLNDVLESEVEVSKSDNNLIIQVNGTSDVIVVEDYLLGNKVETIEFSNGITWNEAKINELLKPVIKGDEGDNNLVGTIESETIYGYGGDDSITGAKGNDILVGGSGNDTYKWNTGDGNDIISDESGVDNLELSINSSQLLIEKSGDDILLNIGNESLSVKDYIVGKGIDSIDFNDGTTWTRSDIDEQLVEEKKGKFFVFDARNISGLPSQIELVGTINSWKSDGNKWIMDEIEDNLFVKFVEETELTSDSHRYKFRKFGDWSQNWGSNGEAFGDDILFNWPESNPSKDIYGTSGDDLIKGTNDSQEIITGLGDDSITGKAGADILKGGSGNDSYKWSIGDGNDEIIDEVGINSLQMSIVSGLLSLEKSGNNLLLNVDAETITVKDYFNNKGVETIELTDTTLSRNDIDDLLNGMIKGTDLDDELTGTAGNDVFLGNKGNDTLIGLAGNDKYIFNKGDGSDLIKDISGSDTIKFNDVLESEVEVSKSDNNLIIQVVGTSDVIVVEDYLSGNKVETIEFSNGIIWNEAKIEELLKPVIKGDEGDNNLVGTIESETIYGYGGNDTITGAKGNDILVGGSGNDTYIWNTGDGNDVINDESGLDKLKLSIGSDQLTLEKSGMDLLLDKETETLTLSDYFGGKEIETIELNDKSYNKQDVEDILNGITRGTDGNDNIIGTSASDKIYAGLGDDTILGNAGNDSIYGEDGSDIITGGKGSDNLYGGQGNDTYIWNTGDGNDIISDESGLDKLELAIDSSQLSIEKTGNDLLLNIGDKVNAESITIKEYVSGKGIDSLELNDKTLSRTEIDEMIKEEPKQIFIFDGRNAQSQSILGQSDLRLELIGTMNSWAGGSDWEMTKIGDKVWAIAVDLEGEYTYKFRRLGDTSWRDNWTQDGVYGTAGNDTKTLPFSYEGKIYGTENNDTLKGTSNDETLYGGFGDDTFIWNIGDGNDTIDASGDDKLKLGISNDKLAVEKSGNNLLLNIESETITVKDYFAGKGINSLEFNDGTIYDRTKIEENIEIPPTPTHLFVFDGRNASGVTSGMDIEIMGTLNGWSSKTETQLVEISDKIWVKMVELPLGKYEYKYREVGNWNKNWNQNGAFYGDNSSLDFDGVESVKTVTVGSDKLVLGTYKDDIIQGGTGDDKLFGYAGNDTYKFGLNSGNDIIEDSFGKDILDLNVNSSDVTIEKTGNDLKLILEDSSLIVKDQFGSGKIESINTLDGSLTNQVNQLVQAMSATNDSGGIDFMNTVNKEDEENKDLLVQYMNNEI